MAKGMVIIDTNRCKGCELCVPTCPTHVLKVSTEKFNTKGYRPIEAVAMEACTGCSLCAVVCPDVVFTVYRQKRQPKASSVAA